ncbi:Receptor-type tyrosine-protein phosphatase mu [Microtus ochrogaster]|uniref:Receptor-type tyrosine-protein phosphatase mu n=1 Tax=Microtus ochrogaster TaxID=79684 RepID=A0A8J6G4K4_MICOH|nr:Receptor-type tyrosine-protein phosphatase mu [Microtus ochrogaster]
MDIGSSPACFLGALAAAAGLQCGPLAISVVLTGFGEVCGCLFDEPYSTCGYSQADDDDFNWEQVNTLTKPTSDPWMPSGLLSLLSLLSEIGASGESS